MAAHTNLEPAALVLPVLAQNSLHPSRNSLEIPHPKPNEHTDHEQCRKAQYQSIHVILLLITPLALT
jgi:hypothetical protein